jgi:uracil phosphoribosyltransferase
MHVEIRHPLLAHKLRLLRDKGTGHKLFRECVNEITLLIAYEALKDLKLEDVTIETPIAKTVCQRLANEIIVVPVLRAGVGMLDGILSLVPEARVGFVGMYRDPETKQPVEYYEKIPMNIENAVVVLIDPMLATAGSLIATVGLIKKRGYKDIRVLSIISAPEGVEALEKAHPDVAIYTGAIDECLNEHRYIVPGLGDAGDRLFGTK